MYWWSPTNERILVVIGKIIQAVYDEIYCRGFQLAILAISIAHINVTKSALYYHLSNKTKFGYALFDEVTAKCIYLSFIKRS